MGLYRDYIDFWQHKTHQQSTACATTQKELSYSQYGLLEIKEVKDKTVIKDIYNKTMFLTSSYNMADYARNWLKSYLSDIVYDIIKNYVDFKSLGASFYADGCYIKTPKGIIERL